MLNPRILAERIYIKIQTKGPRQVRYWHGMLLTYPYPCRRGYGTRGQLVGVYNLATDLDWIVEDVCHVQCRQNDIPA